MKPNLILAHLLLNLVHGEDFCNEKSYVFNNKSRRKCRVNVNESSPIIPGCEEDAKIPSDQKGCKKESVNPDDKICLTYVSLEQKKICLNKALVSPGKFDVGNIPFEIRSTGKHCGSSICCKNNYGHTYFNITIQGAASFRIRNTENCDSKSQEAIECQPRCVDVNQSEKNITNYVREGAFSPTGDFSKGGPFKEEINQMYEFNICNTVSNLCGHYWLSTPSHFAVGQVILLLDKKEYEENGELVVYIPKHPTWNRGVLRIHRSESSIDAIDGCDDDENIVHTQEVTENNDGKFYHKERVNHALRHGFIRVSWNTEESIVRSCSVQIIRKSFGHVVISLIILCFVLVGFVCLSLHFINKRRDRELKAVQLLQSKTKNLLVLADEKAGLLFKQNVQNFVNYLTDFHVLNYNIIYSGDVKCQGLLPTEDPQAWWKRIISDKDVEENYFIMLVVSPASQPQKYKPVNLVEIQLMEMQPTNFTTGMLYSAYEDQKLAVIQFPDSAPHPKDGIPGMLPAEYFSSLFCLPDNIDDLLELMKGDLKDFVLPEELVPKKNCKWKTFFEGYYVGKVLEEKKEKPAGSGVKITMEEDICHYSVEKGKEKLSEDLPALMEMEGRDKTTTNE